MDVDQSQPATGSKSKRKKTDHVEDAELRKQLLGQNKFATLAQQQQATDDQTPVVSTADSGKRKPPPLVVKNAKFEDIMAKLANCVVSTEPMYRVNRFGIKILCVTPEDYENVKTHLELHGLEFYTHDKPADRPYRVVLRGMPMVDIKKLKDALKLEYNLIAEAVHVIRRKDEATDQNEWLHLIHFAKGHTNLKQLSEVKTVARICVRWEKYQNRRADVTQCLNCLYHGHGTRNCHLKSRCNICGEGHTTDECTRKDAPAKRCANCNGAHPATDRGCPKRADYVRFRQQASASNQRGKKTARKDPATPALTMANFPPLQTRTAPPGYTPGPSQQRHIDPRTRAGTTTPPPNPSAGETEQPLFTSAELWAMFTDLTTRLRNCKTRAEQFDVLGYMACHYGVKAKKFELSTFLAQHNIDVGVLTETRLNPSVNFSLPAHTMIRLDRSNGSGGGVAVIVKHGIRYEILPHPKTSIIEAIGVKIHASEGGIELLAVYAPRQCADSNGTASIFMEDLQKLTSNRSGFVVAGDLNARHSLWLNHRSNKNGNVLADHLTSGTCVIHFPDNPTFLSPAGTTSTLDIFLSDLALSKPVTHQQLSSDHYPVVCELNLDPSPAPLATRKDYHRVNWNAFSRLVDSCLPDDADLSSVEAIEEHLGIFEQAVHTAEEACIRKVPVRRQFVAIDTETQRLIQQRNAVRRQFQRSGCLRKKQEMSIMNSVIQNRMLEIRNQRFSRDLEQMDERSKPFWKMAKILKKRPTAIPPLKEDSGILVSPTEKANAIANKLVEAHNLGANMPSPHEAAVQHTIGQLEDQIDEPFTGQVTEDDVRAAVNRGKNMKAPGTDSIVNLVLKKLSGKAMRYLAAVFTSCFQRSYFPDRWKTGKVVPILKPGKDPTSPSSYRPISLLSAVSKVFERLILWRVMAHVEDQQIIVPEQFGFRKGHSAVHQLVRVENIINQNKQLSSNTAMVLLDVEKAFDNVWHDGLVHKLVQANFPSYLVRMVRNYLTNRNFRVHLPGATSELKPVPAGVPQGSLLGPILYSIFTSDAPQLPAGCSLALYADDSAIIANGRSPTIYRSRLQRGTTAYVQYLVDWKIKVNELKSQAIVFRHRPSPKLLPPDDCFIRVNGRPVEWTNEAVYLGVTLDSKLLYQAHTERLRNRCIGMLKSLYPLINRRSHLSRTNKLAVFKSIIAPMVNYAMPVWGSCAETHKRKLQVVQNRLLRTILDAPYTTRITELHRSAGCRTIHERINDSMEALVDSALRSDHPLIRALVN